MKKLMLILLMLCCLLPALAEEVTSGDYVYTLDGGGNATIKKYQGESADLSIPEEIDGHTVVALGSFSFSGALCETVHIPDTVRLIDNHAFYSCINLTEINIPDSVSEIEENPFSDCSSLLAVDISEDHPLLTVMDNALVQRQDMRLVWYPSGLTELRYTVPDGVRVIGRDAFHCCYNLVEVTLPDSVRMIDSEAFCGCSSLWHVNFPDSMDEIGYGAFKFCGTLADVMLPSDLGELSALAFDDCDSLRSVVIPESITELNTSVFGRCDRLEEVVIPGSVRSIDRGNPFTADVSLTSIVIDEDHPYLELIDNVLFVRDGHRLIFYPPALEAESYAIPDGCKAINEAAFIGCANLKELIIPDSVTEIGDWPFDECENLTELFVPESVQAIGRNAFRDIRVRVKAGSFAEQYCIENGCEYTLVE